MPRASKPKPSYNVASAMDLLARELARLDAIDRGESVPEDLALARAELADEKREHQRSIDAYDAMRRERDAIAESRDRARARLAELERQPSIQILRERIARIEDDATATESYARLQAERDDLHRKLDAMCGADPMQDHHALCWRAFRDAIVSMQGATETEGDGDTARRIGAPDHPLESLAEAVLRASEGAASMGALSCAQTLAAELHALARDATAWRTFVRRISDDDWRDNPSDETSVGADMHERIDRVSARASAAQGYGRQRNAATWTCEHAGELGQALADAAIEGLAYAQTSVDDTWRENAERGDKIDAEGDHGAWWRTFVSVACGSPKLDGSASRLAWALRRGGLPVTSCDDTIETVEACAEIIGAVLDRSEANRVA